MPTNQHPRSLLLALALVLALATGAAAQQGSYEEQEGDILLEADLDGDNEVNIGDDDGGGDAEIAIREDFSELCWRLEAENVDGANAAHIHEGAEDQDGDVVVTLSVADNATSEGCTTMEGAEIFQRIAEDPEAFYVNVHTPAHPGGAIRGQLNEQEPFLDDGFLDDNDQQGGDDMDDEDNGTGADPQDGGDADTPAPGFALVIAVIAGLALVVAVRRRK